MWYVLLSETLYHRGDGFDMENQECARSVMLVFVDRHTELHTLESAERVCCDSRRAGLVIDALTDDRRVQSFLRECIDNTGDQTDTYS